MFLKSYKKSIFLTRSDLIYEEFGRSVLSYNKSECTFKCQNIWYIAVLTVSIHRLINAGVLNAKAHGAQSWKLGAVNNV